MNKKLRLSLLLIALSATTPCSVIIAQNVNTLVPNTEYLDNFDWMVKTFSENDAGFKYYLEEKGMEDYTRHTESFRKKISEATSEREFLNLMNGWLNYFRKGHIGVFPTGNNQPDKQKKYPIGATYKEKEQADWLETDFLQYLEEHKNAIHPIEGIWKSPFYKIGIARSPENKNQFNAFIFEEKDNICYIAKQKYIELYLLENGTFDNSIYISNNPKDNMTPEWIGDSKGIIRLRDLYWKKISPAVSFSAKDAFTAATFSSDLYIKKISESTIYLRIPSFAYKNKIAIDSLLAKNDHLIRSTPNLIIDIRNGTGGSDSSHGGLLPYYYTQSIRCPGAQYYATELNAKAYEQYAKVKTPNDTLGIKYSLSVAQEMRNNLGTYFGDGAFGQLNYSGKPLPYPSKIAIICNEQNASADESFLYKARQSYKVKIFGKPTGGAFDFSNLNIVDFPNRKYRLWLTITKSQRYPDYKIDDIGIQPDFYIDDGIKDWVEYVQSVIEGKGK